MPNFRISQNFSYITVLIYRENVKINHKLRQKYKTYTLLAIILSYNNNSLLELSLTLTEHKFFGTLILEIIIIYEPFMTLLVYQT